MSITALTEGFGVTRQAITKHLHVMEDAGLVQCRRQGRESIWHLHPQRVGAARRYLALISKRWDETLGRLRTFVEN